MHPRHWSSCEPSSRLEIARRIAVVLEDETVRAALSDAIRASRWQEHKLDLHAFVLNGPPRVRDALAAHHSVESDRALVGHMLVVHPAKPRSPRSPRSLAPFALLVSSASSSCAETIAEVRLTYFRIFRDDGLFGGANKMKFRGRQLDVNGVPGTGVTYAVGGISTNRDCFPNVSLDCVGFFSGSFSHQIWEMDGEPSSANLNDFFAGRGFPPTSYNVAVLYSDSSIDYGFATISNP